MRDSVKIKDHLSAKDVLKDSVARKGRGQRVSAARESLAGKKFVDLTAGEKDSLLQALAIRAGLIEE
jgi:hypothetical protein